MAATKRDSFLVTENDRAAMDAIKEKNLLGSASLAVRFAVLRQLERDETEPRSGRTFNKRWNMRDDCMDMLRKSREYGKDEVALHQMIIWRRPEITSALEKIRDTWDFNKLAEALRFAIRIQAEIDGFTPTSGW